MEFDDVLHQAAEMVGGVVKTFLPFGFIATITHRHPKITIDFSKLDDILMERCFAQAIARNTSPHAHTSLQRNR